jgi:hypothetical protein
MKNPASGTFSSLRSFNFPLIERYGNDSRLCGALYDTESLPYPDSASEVLVEVGEELSIASSFSKLASFVKSLPACFSFRPTAT